MNRVEIKIHGFPEDLPGGFTPDTWVALDLEIFGMEKKRLHRADTGTFACASLTYNGYDVYVLPYDHTWLQHIVNMVQGCNLVMQNGDFDIRNIRRWASFPQHTKWYDTMYMERILYNGYYDAFSLKDLARRYLSVLMDKETRSDFEKSDKLTDEMIYYAAMDAAITWHVAKEQRKIASQEELDLWYYIDQPCIYAVMDMPGVKIDKNKWSEVATRNQEIVDEEIKRFTFNPRSPKQVVQYFADKEMIKLKSSDADTLEKLDSPMAKRIIQFRQVAKLASTYGMNWLEDYIEPDDRVYSHINVIGAETGRMSSDTPNCYSQDTQILTNSGWKYFYELRSDDKVASLNEYQEIEFVFPSEFISYPINDYLVSIKSDTCDLLVTKNHRMVSMSRNDKLIIDEAEDWVNYNSSKYIKIVDRKLIRGGYIKRGVILNDDQRCLLAKAVCIQAEGWISSKGNVEVSILSDRKKMQFIKLFPNYQSRGSDRICIRTTIKDPAITEWINIKDKTFKIEKILELCQSDLEFFLDQIFMWDGDFTRKMQFVQKNCRKSAVDAVEIAAILTGHSTKRSSLKDVYSVCNIHRKNLRYASRMTITKEWYQGNVYCVTVPSGMIIVRRNEKVIVSGNCQNIPIRSNPIFRECFVADEGNVFVIGDYSSQEPRCLAFESKDEALMDIFRQNKDIYCETGRTVWNEEILKGDPRRGIMKIVVLGLSYGMSVKGVARDANIGENEAEEVVSKFLTTYNGFARWCIKQQKAKNYVTNALGRKIWLNRHNTQYVRNALNGPIQSDASDITKLAVILLHKRWPKNIPFGLVLIVHDEIVVEVPAKFAEKAQKFLEKCMIDAEEMVIPGIPPKVEIYCGKDWSAKH